jgi:hypothetical protein
MDGVGSTAWDDADTGRGGAERSAGRVESEARVGRAGADRWHRRPPSDWRVELDGVAVV